MGILHMLVPLLITLSVCLTESSPVYDQHDDAVHLNASESDIRIFYYSRKSTGGIEISHDNYKGSIDETDFNKSKRTIFAVHGWQNSKTSPFCEVVKDAYLQAADVNVFMIDWNDIAKWTYLTALAAVPEVAVILGKLIESLTQNYHLDLDNTLIVGHSLGAHIAGLTGAALNGKVNTIIGLDPAGPGFSENKLNERLDPSDGKFVQAVHTCPGLLGANYRVGRSDYYANDGRKQPGCGVDLAGTCAHGRAYAYFAESVKTGKFQANQCTSYANFHSGECANNKKSTMGGYNVDESASGTYYFETNASPPYAKW